VNIFDNPCSVTKLTSNFPHRYRDPNVSPSFPAPKTRISIQYFWSLLAIPEKLKSRIISNLEFSIQYFWKLCAHQPSAAKNPARCPNPTISSHAALIAPQFSIFSFPFSSSANMAP
jgi:hypothetical protein